MDRDVAEDLASLGLDDELPQAYRCPNYDCLWFGSEPLNVRMEVRRWRNDVRCPHCFTWITEGIAPNGNQLQIPKGERLQGLDNPRSDLKERWPTLQLLEDASANDATVVHDIPPSIEES